MGEAKKRQISKKNFLLQPENRLCCYCGAPADSVDHFPPRNVFIKRMFPEGYMFPACKSCNLGKSKDEQSLSLLICLMDWDIDENDEEFSRLVKAVRNNNPKLIDEMRSLSSVESKRHLRFQFGNNENINKRRFVGWKGIEIGSEGKRLLDLMCIWFAQTMYFKHNQEIFRGEVIFTDIPFRLLREKQFWDMVKKLSSSAVIVHTGHNISKQFFYRYFSVKGGFFSIFQFRNPQTLFLVCALAEEQIVDNLDIPEGWRNSGLIGPKK